MYPIVIFLDRYQGHFSGGEWVALKEEPPGSYVPGDEKTDEAFWKSYKFPYGVGDTPNEAVSDLQNKLNKLSRIPESVILELFLEKTPFWFSIKKETFESNLAQFKEFWKGSQLVEIELLEKVSYSHNVVFSIADITELFQSGQAIFKNDEKDLSNRGYSWKNNLGKDSME